MSERGRTDLLPPDEEDIALERIVRDRKEGEIESGMLSGSDDGDISATDRFEGEMTPEAALDVLDPEHARHA